MFKKFATLSIAILMCLSGCGDKATDSYGENQVTISVSNWPDPNTHPDVYETYEGYVSKMKELYNIVVEGDVTSYTSSRVYTVKGLAGQLPTIYQAHFTELRKIIEAGFAADISAQMKNNQYIASLSPSLVNLCVKDDKVYFIPFNAYLQGLHINRALFEQAGLINSDGSVLIPSTYTELAEFASTIKEKTGVPGFALPTTNNWGGWHFTNIAWSNGVEFMEENGDGTWSATFDTPECVEALTYIKDLKWKHNVLPANAFINGDELEKIFASGGAAMVFMPPIKQGLITKYGMEREDIIVASMPEGTAGRYAQMGGATYVVSNTATEEQIDAVFKWLEMTGFTPKYTDATVESWKENAKSENQEGKIVLPKSLTTVWVNEERQSAYENAVMEYVNSDMKNFQNYYDAKGVMLKSEYPVCTQELYSVIDDVIQEIITNQESDVEKLVTEACAKFQSNHLDKLER